MASGGTIHQGVVVVTPTKNSAEFLDACIRSVRMQSELVIAHFIVDGGSTDRTLDIAEAQTWERLEVIQASGTSAPQALNVGLEHAPECFAIGILNSDDEYEPGSIRTAAMWLQDHPAVDVLSGGLKIIDDAGRCMGTSWPDRFVTSLYARGLVRIAHPSTFVRWRNPLDEVRYPEDNETCWDGEYFLRLAANGASFSVIDEVLARFRVHTGSISSSDNSERYRRRREMMFRQVIGREITQLDALLLAYGEKARKALDLINGRS